MEFSVNLWLPPVGVIMTHHRPSLRVPQHPVLADVELESGHDLVDVRDPLVDTSHLLCHVPIPGEAGVTVLGGVQQCGDHDPVAGVLTEQRPDQRLQLHRDAGERIVVGKVGVVVPRGDHDVGPALPPRRADHVTVVGVMNFAANDDIVIETRHTTLEEPPDVVKSGAAKEDVCLWPLLY